MQNTDNFEDVRSAREIDWSKEFFKELEKLRSQIHGDSSSWPKLFGFASNSTRECIGEILMDDNVRLDVEHLTPEELQWLMDDKVSEAVATASLLEKRGREMGRNH